MIGSALYYSLVYEEIRTLTALDTILSRCSIGKVTEQRPSREQIEQLLEAAVRAPNHHLTNPWRFFVVAGDARDQLGDLMANLLASQLADPSSEHSQALIKAERAKPLRAPVLIIAAACPTRDGKVIEQEEISATAAAVQNILLAAHAMGLGAQWRTGNIAFDGSLKRWLGLHDDDHVIGIVYLGYPAMESRQSPRKPAAEVTRWIGWD